MKEQVLSLDEWAEKHGFIDLAEEFFTHIEVMTDDRVMAASISRLCMISLRQALEEYSDLPISDMY